jgi:DNA-binding MarR family transcriptional regulator
MQRKEDPELSSSMAQSFGQVLIKSARLYNESAIAQLREHVPGVRTAHTLLFPFVPMSGVRLTDLAKKVGVSKQAVAQLVDELVVMGAFVKVPDPSDGRARLIQWSDGSQIRSGLAALEQVQRPLVQALGAERMARLQADLGDVLRVLEGL